MNAARAARFADELDRAVDARPAGNWVQMVIRASLLSEIAAALREVATAGEATP